MQPYKEYIKDNTNFKILFENTMIVVGHVFENSYCFNKFTKEEFDIFQFDNDPYCGIVGQNNDWCLIGGDILVLKNLNDKSLRSIGELKHIFDLKSIDPYTTQILTDPWSENPEIWQISIDINNTTKPFILTKIKNFIEYIDKPYEENVEW